MTERAYPVEVQPDYLEKITRAKPPQALAELVWNSLDADARNVSVRFGHNDLGRMSKIQVRDNGTGIVYDKAPELFKRLGGSWKRPGAHTDKENRFLHGQEGRGRFKAFALGSTAQWEVIYERGGALFSFDIFMSADRIREVRISTEVEAPEHSRIGVTLTIENLYPEAEALQGRSALQELTEIFALYLANYSSAEIEVDGNRLDLAQCVVSRESIALPDLVDEDETYAAKLDIIEWKDATSRSLYLCNDDGLPLSRLERRFHIGSFQFSGYLKSNYVSSLQSKGTLDVAEMNPVIVQAADTAQEEIKKFFRRRSAEEAKTVVEQWKEQKIYPYRGDAKNQVEKIERQVFDIVAVSAAQYLPDFATTENKSRALHLRLLRSAIEKSPSELQLILGEVLRLPKRKRDELAGLLKDVSLSAIISAAKVVSDRLDFLVALEAILFDTGPKSRLKERTQLHRIVAKNAWIFGEEYNISVNDRSLTEVLRQHKRLLGEYVIVESPVKHISQERGIVDLVLSRTIRRHQAQSLSHLVVELKAPKVKIDRDEITQIEEYAISIQADARFKTDKRTDWTFWVISDDHGDYARHRMSQDPLHPGRIFKSDVSSIWVKTWAQVLEDNRSRLQFFQERLEYEADKGAALRKLQDQHAKLLQGVLDDPPKETADNIDELAVGELVDEIEPDSNEDEFDVEDEETVVGP
jgi:Histidine kinase-, DNA gyrase B-, and HSP90-like ATPase/Type I restriction enzyme R protein N terminus (HSDR_N)